jgi:SPP1 family predicted phage head-tail adaptor
MQAGKLRHRVTIQQATETRNTLGEAIKTWSTVATVYASVEPIRGREFFAAEQVQSEISHRVRMRYRSGLAPRMRLLYGSRMLQIEAVIDVEERHRETQLMCREMPDA